ncbi:vacuolar protein sorting-associated protein 16 [Sistotremastrum suecicum HHB10207 ss-3]|uniref:Probable vacuolar protein sorting-associated protein 16 homolog n=1 Tax=Sistotremastrum suecicum HHB10207 ss-3 TaxID=1314776 RepID=A0A166AJM2_9AGAM|nr:vacuolar protein sorting-associated protein 16 [Sistotremastrum suecicum HHB10207 ss-3]
MSDVPHPTSSWEPIQEGRAFYKKYELYSLHWKVADLSEYIVSGARYGGPLAMMRDTSKLVALGRSTTALTKSQVQIYSSSGEGLLLFSWDQGKIIRMGWTFDERLVLLNEEGVYRLYDLQGEYQQFSLGPDAAEAGIIDAKIHENGLVALTSDLRLLHMKGWDGGKPLELANPGLSEPPHSWCVIPPDLTISQHVEVLLSTAETVFSVDTLESQDQRLSRGPFTFLSPSPNGKSLALLTFAGVLWVVSADFQTSLAEFDTKEVIGAEGSVKQVEWCGNDAVLASWDGLSVLVGPYGDSLRYYYPTPTFAVTEPDGVRIHSSQTVDLLQKVPSSSLAIFRPGSSSPAATLFDAWEHYTRRSPKCEESIRSIRPDLASAVDECIDAAGREWEPYWQKRLLNAAKYGRAYLDLYNPTDFVNMGQTLKVLNAVRFYEIGIPITYTQYIQASPSHLISRLLSRSLHLLALRVSVFLALKPDPVLRHWASAKIAKGKIGDVSPEDEDDEICKAIVDKFQKLGGEEVSYAEVARRAWEVGRSALAIKLLDHESQAAQQVPLLLAMKEDNMALEKAVDSGDTDLVYHVLLHLYKRMPLGAFFKLIEEGGTKLIPASKLLQVYAREQDRDLLRDFYYSDDRRLESAVLAFEESSRMTDPGARITGVTAAQKFFSEDKERAFEAKMVDEQNKLLVFQQQLEKETDGQIKFFGLSVNETIKVCLLNGMAKRAEKIRADFKVPDKRFWYTKLHALTQMRDFEGLDAFAKSRRSPIGYEAFVRHLIEKGHQKEAVNFVARCDSKKRVDLYVECGDWRMAGRECKERGDRAKLEQLRATCTNTLMLRELDQIAASMN